MIRVFRLAAQERLGAPPARAPDVAGPTPAEVLAAARALVLPAAERTAIEQALREVGGARSADIVVAPGGAIYRVFRDDPRPEPKAPPSPRAPSDAAANAAWAAKERGALVLVADATPAASALSELLAFLGYRAEALVTGDAPTLGQRLEQIDPLVVVLGPALTSRFDGDLLATCRSKPRGVVLLGDADAHKGVDATIPLPIASANVAAVIDGAVRSAQRERSH